MTGSFTTIVNSIILLVSMFPISFLSSAETDLKREPVTLTAKEEKALRDSIYNRRLGTCIATEGSYFSHKIVVVPVALTEIHKNKRIETLKLLLTIAKGGRPIDAITATCYAVALEKNPVLALPFVYYSADDVDQKPQKGDQRVRDDLIEEVAELLDAVGKR